MRPDVPVVFVHVHYPDVWAEMARELAVAFDRPFGLVLTCRDAAMPLATVESPHLAFQRRLTVENRGRDVLPFTAALRDLGPSFTIGLKLHTKRSVHREDGEGWRRYLTGSLLERGGGTGPKALDLMEREPAIGLVAPRAHLLPLQGRIVLNAWIIRRMIRLMGVPLTMPDLETRRFAAGSMFWFRREALTHFENPDLPGLFAPEKGQLDGTAAHGAERLFAAVVELEGFAATAAEAVDPVANAAGEGPLSKAEIDAVSDATIDDAANPFILPMARFWRRHPYALIAAHQLYTRSPKPVWRLARRLLKRFTVDREPASRR
ncbi:MAG: rhamnan synthesis F family protein [Methylobacterium sp.]